MAKNSELIPTTGSGFLGGFGNFFKSQNQRWWRTRKWLVQTLVWLLILNGVVAILLFVAPNQAEYAQEEAGITAEQINENPGAAPLPMEDLDFTTLAVFISMVGLAPAIGVIILGQEAMITEKNHGTAAWVLSKPISRTAFVLAKIVSNSLGVLITMIIIQGAAAYLLIWQATGTAFPLLPYAGAMGLSFLSLLFFLSLTIMLGSISNSRGLVIGIPLVIALGYQLLSMIGKWVPDIMPWNLSTGFGPTRPAIALAVIVGMPLPTILPIIATAAWCVLFTGVAIWRFGREEF